MTKDDAQRQIASILAQLERDTDCLVEAIEVKTVDVTGLDDSRPQHRKAVIIETQRRPGNDWVI